MPEWVPGTERQLARSSRPGYCGRNVPKSVVDEWLSEVKGMGIRSIICLLTEDELDYYKQIPGGLLGYYRSNGLLVKHRPIKDPVHHSEGWHELEIAVPDLIETLAVLPKPVLVHCSAGMDRTGMVVSRMLEAICSSKWQEWAGDRPCPNE